jgi:DNA processing protein
MEVVTIKLGSKDYPKLLSEIHNPPKLLYCRGNLSLLQTLCLAVVGTRKITPYGKETVEYIAGTLAQHFTIVSGLALGIDAAAHQAALNNHGKTIAVLGSGVDDATLGPRTNFKLAQDILANDGLIISEYAPGMRATEFTFPARNRIISGLSLGTIIIEADKESGALITADRALEQNRDVFAVPGSIFWPRSIGPNLLIQKGAKLVQSPQDILQEYLDRQDQLPELKLSTGQNPIEQKIIDILKSNGPSHIDSIIKESNMETPRVIASVSILEIKNIIKHIGNGIYRL